ncbi:hypothetical protein KHA80_18195 [Anaerobacillus sp. HL2]|nr:hypothetical protein KHA80_18195 [Anaerobacillus sp. HL2]
MNTIICLSFSCNRRSSMNSLPVQWLLKGMAEVAVEKVLGNDVLAPWVSSI